MMHRRLMHRRLMHRRLMRWRTAIVAAVACGALATSGALAGCSSSAESASSGQSITLYSGQHEQTTDGLAVAFEKQSGITVNVRNDDEDTLANLIAVQGRTRRRTSSTRKTPPRWSSYRKRACWLPLIRAPCRLRRPSTTRNKGTGSGFLPGSA